METVSKAVLKLHVSEGDSPREWDNLSIIATKNFVGDESISDPIDWLAKKIGLTEDGVMRIANKLGVNYYTDEVRAELEERFFNKFVGKPLYKYEHGNIALSTTPFGCRWDSGQVGYIYTTKEKARENFGIKRITKDVRTSVMAILEGELETFETYVRGEVYGYTVEDEDGEVLDSCGGFYGTNWDSNGILDHVGYVEHGLASTRAEILEILEETDIDY